MNKHNIWFIIYIGGGGPSGLRGDLVLIGGGDPSGVPGDLVLIGWGGDPSGVPGRIKDEDLLVTGGMGLGGIVSLNSTKILEYGSDKSGIFIS